MTFSHRSIIEGSIILPSSDEGSKCIFGAFGPTQQAAISVPNTLPDSWLRSPRKAFGRVGIPSGGRNPALCTKTLRDSSCPGLPRMTGRAGLAAGSRLDDLAPVERKPQGKPDPGKGGGGTPRSGRKHRRAWRPSLSVSQRFHVADAALRSHSSRISLQGLHARRLVSCRRSRHRAPSGRS